MGTNIFTALRVAQNEVVMCRFLADLLDPEGWSPTLRMEQEGEGWKERGVKGRNLLCLLGGALSLAGRGERQRLAEKET